MPDVTTAKDLLDKLNQEYFDIHKTYEDLFWKNRMGDASLAEATLVARQKRDDYRSDEQLLQQIKEVAAEADEPYASRLLGWANFLELYQVPKDLRPLHQKILELEDKIRHHRAHRKEGYIDPTHGEFVPTSKNKLYLLMRTHEDEAVRKAAFEATEKLNIENVDDYVQLVGMRNQYAQALGYDDFYSYKARINEQMTKEEIFDIFQGIFDATKNYYFGELDKRIADDKRLLDPWNRGYLLSGDYTKQEDPYFQFSEAVDRWGRSFAAMGIKFRGGTLQLDLLDRPGKENNGFCHWPDLIRYDGDTRIPGSTNFTANVVLGQVGAGHRSLVTLFHEGGHAAHLMNADSRDIYNNHEYPPASTAWDETQSQFIDTLMSSVEWSDRYAKDSDGASYPFELYAEQVEKLSFLRAGAIYSIFMIMSFERWVYEDKDLTAEKVVEYARRAYAMVAPQGAGTAVFPLTAMHIYDWEASCAYHGYGLADIAVAQWRDYFYTKYGYIVDNPSVYSEMSAVWKYGAEKSFAELVQEATGKPLAPDAYARELNMPPQELIERAKSRLNKMAEVPPFDGAVDLDATIRMVHGTEVIADNSISFEDMATRYRDWIIDQTK